ncbi:MAG TPA: capsule assembly Wzi family protein, partial [Bacillota bacterium]|nr:capsule assembly Wzi family protein [Bacillota bacterium]
YSLGISQLCLDWQTEKAGFSIGRKIITFGPGRYGYPMLGPLGTGLTAEGYDQAGYHFTWGNLGYQKFYAWVPESGFRMLLGQRTTCHLGPFVFGFSEAALVNDQAPDYVYLPIPFLPIYLYQFLGYHVFKTPHTNETINAALDFDLTWQPSVNLKLYGEYYIDDRPWPSLDQNNQWVTPTWDQWWWKVGYQAGLEWKNAFQNSKLTLYTEYTRIDQYTYTSWHPGDWTPGLDWTYLGRFLGDSLGPDADRFNLELVWERSPSLSWSFAYRRVRRGEGKIGDHWSYTPGQTEVFLTGVVETTDGLAVGVIKKTDDAEISLTVGLANINNADHVAGNNKIEPTGSVNVKILLP